MLLCSIAKVLHFPKKLHFLAKVLDFLAFTHKSHFILFPSAVLRVNTKVLQTVVQEIQKYLENNVLVMNEHMSVQSDISF